MHKEPILRIDRISKSYYGVKALKDVSFDIYKGEIIGLLGANGAGKSTLLKIIGGVEKASDGHILLENIALDHVTPHSAKLKGIISVYQELNLFLNMTVAENLFIGRENRGKMGILDWQQTTKMAKEVLDSLGLDISPDAEVGCLSVAKQHLIEIARALNEKPKLLLLDEPTATLSDLEINWLFSRVRELAKEGTTVIYVSHRLDEVTELCERCVILRDGALAHELSGDFSKDHIVNSMIGHNVELLRPENKNNENEIVFECQHLTYRNTVKDISFQLRKGEILGIAGLVGAGRTELLRTIFGVDRMTSGKILVKGNEIQIKQPRDAMHHGIALVPEDRKMEGLFLEENMRFNIASSTIEKRASLGMINASAEKQVANQVAKSVQLDTGRMEHLVKLLSGGNQQKAVIAKTLLVNSDILILDEPTRGVDIGAREEIYEIIKDLANEGKAILLVSSDWEELVYLSDRMLVMAEGRITGELSADEVTEEKIMNLSTIADVKTGVCITPKCPPADGKRRNLFAAVFEEITNFYRNNNVAILVFMLIGIVVIGLLFAPSFGKWMNIRNMMGQSMPLFLLAIGQFIVIITGGLDLSSGAMLASSGVLGVSIMLNNPNNTLLAIFVMIMYGILVGSLNALLVVKARLDSFVVTLGMSIVLTGVTLVITKNPIGPSPKILRQIVNDDVFGIPYVLFILIALMVAVSILLKYTATGRQFYAVGENAKGALWAGLPVQRTQFISFIISSFMAVLASIFFLGRTGAGDPAFGPGMELVAIAAALIGGAVFGGGKGKLGGVICGVLVLVFLENILSLMHVELWYQEVIEGTLLLAILISYELRIRKRKALSCMDN